MTSSQTGRRGERRGVALDRPRQEEEERHHEVADGEQRCWPARHEPCRRTAKNTVSSGMLPYQMRKYCEKPM